MKQRHIDLCRVLIDEFSNTAPMVTRLSVKTRIGEKKYGNTLNNLNIIF